MSKQPSKILFFLLHFSFFILSSCYEPQEGCLDIDATNYSISADDPCATCCTYPTLTLAFNHLVESTEDTVSLRYGVFYPNEGTAITTDSFMLDRARFFISNVLLVQEDSTTVDVEEELELEFASGDPQTVSDNFANLDRSTFSARTIGYYQNRRCFQRNSFHFGIGGIFATK